MDSEYKSIEIEDLIGLRPVAKVLCASLLGLLVPTWSQVRTSAALIEAYDFSITIYRKRRRILVC